MRAFLTTVLELAGVALIVTGAAMVYVPAAFVVGGCALVRMAWAVDAPEVTE